jgi:hypothetical protein
VKISAVCVVGAIALSSGFAMGHGFHVDAKEVAAALEVGVQPSAAYREEVKRLRAESERLHRVGKHHEAEQMIEQAAKLEYKK